MRLLVIIPSLIFALLAPDPGAASPLEQVLAAMDRASKEFRDMSARVVRIEHTAVINDTSQESGTIRMKRSGRDTRVMMEITDPDPKTLLFQKSTAQVYYPKINTVQEYDLGKQRKLVDQFLLLGFGSTPAELRKNYTLRVIGEEKISGETATQLELTPLAASVREHLSKAGLWINSAGYPLRQKFDKPSADYMLITYDGLRINTSFPDSAFNVIPRNAKRERPQK